MKKMFMLCSLLVIAIPQMATADHIGIYTDCTGSSCTLAPGFTSTTAVVHKFSTGTTASRFKLVFPAGTVLFTFQPGGGIPPFVLNGDVQTGVLVQYGECRTGNFCIGQLVASLAPGPLCMRPANGFTDVMHTDCGFVETPATRGSAMVGSHCVAEDAGGERVPCDPVAVESSTWGSVKALYR
jgi:hypothetical protein